MTHPEVQAREFAIYMGWEKPQSQAESAKHAEFQEMALETVDHDGYAPIRARTEYEMQGIR